MTVLVKIPNIVPTHRPHRVVIEVSVNPMKPAYTVEPLEDVA
jgi:hypothetical protein